MKILDLFSGIGGFSLGLESTGCFETVAFCEKEEFCRRVLKKHWPDVPIWEDIHDVSGFQFRGVDLICGGFPCQPVSLAGARKGDKDDRWLWPEFFRVIREAQPRWCLVENVTGLRTKHADEVLADLEGQGYTCWPLVVGAVHAGAPHRRQRMWIVAYANGQGEPKLFQYDEVGRVLGKYAPDTERPGLEKRQSQPGDTRTQFAPLERGGIAPDTPQQLPHRAGARSTGRRELANGSSQWDWSRAPEPVLRRVDDGLPCGLDRTKRLKALGNAVVPQVVAQIGYQIAWGQMLW